ncbi:biotin/lipoyl-containing protein [Mesonia mobilis]|uniref:biotin/lipoyl-containing protein n=1 Tax=Mesonia mobilis TaxID=369791 RepID=UPI0026E9E687|nr:biotin/lipoyl-containing protein [Mesonia mobilis]
MIKSLIHRLFQSSKKRSEILNDLKSNPNFQTESETDFNQADFTLKKGKVETIYSPNLGNQKGLVLTKWYVEPDDLVNQGEIICLIENENITMEFESFYSGKIISTCKLHQKLSNGTELFKIEGI